MSTPPSPLRGPRGALPALVLATVLCVLTGLLAGAVAGPAGAAPAAATVAAAPPAAPTACPLGIPAVCDLLPTGSDEGDEPTATTDGDTAGAAGGGEAGPITPAPESIPWQRNPEFVDVPARCRDAMGLPRTEATPCRITRYRPKAPTIVLWGDSHAWHMLPALRQAVGNKRVNLVFFFAGACPPMVLAPGVRTGAVCDQFGPQVISWLTKQRKAGKKLRVVVGIAWELYHDYTDPLDGTDELYPGYRSSTDYIETNAYKSLRGTPAAFRQLGKLRIPTDIIMPMPMVWTGAPECDAGPTRCPLPRVGTLKDARENQARAWRMHRLLTRRGRMIKPAQGLCGPTTCQGTIGGVPVYYDPLHIGQRTSRTLARYFKPTVEAAKRMGR